MRYVRQVCILLGLLASSGAFGAERIRLAPQVAPIPVAPVLAADRIRLAQAVQAPTQGQVQPIPLTPTPLLSSQTATACLVSCDTQVMNCQNACVVAGPDDRHREPRRQRALQFELHDPAIGLQADLHQTAAVGACAP